MDSVRIDEEFYQLIEVFDRRDEKTTLVYFCCKHLESQEYYIVHIGSLGSSFEFEDYRKAYSTFLMIMKGESPKTRSRAYKTLKEAFAQR